MQIKPEISAPHNLNEEIIKIILLFIIILYLEIIINPYLPNFKSIAANLIDPATGASTWAFGNHKCVKYIGVFTRNAIIIIIHQ